MTLDIAAFARVLRAIPSDEFGPPRLNPLLGSLALNPGSVAPFARFKAGGYTRNLVYADEHFELMVLAWAEGSQSTIHDHMGQQCWFVAHSGRFDIENYRRIAGGSGPGYARLSRLDTETGISIGMPDYRGPDNEIHRVRVPGGSGEAVSVHVYAKPIGHCLIFDEGQQSCIERELTFDTYTQDRIVLADGP